MDSLLDVPLAGIVFKLLKIRQKLGQIKKEILLSEDELRIYQLQTLKKLMAHAYARIPLYREKWKTAGVGPDNLRSLADLCKFPIITKEDVRNAPLADIMAAGQPRTKYHIFKTTGSSGEPVSILYDRDRGFYEIAEISTFSINMHFRLNLKKGMSILVLDEEAMEILPALEFPRMKKYLFDALDGVERHIEQINRVRPDYLVTYPSILKTIALKVQAEKIRIHQPKLLLTTGETHDGHTRKVISDTFTGELLDGYAATETGVVAIECPAHHGLHVLGYKAIIEIVDDGGNLLPPGEIGNVIVTDLKSGAFPLIRYSGMGDIAGYHPGGREGCRCHLSALPRLSRIEGRRIDSIILPDQTVIHPFKLTLLMQDIPEISKFQIRQEKRDEVVVLIVASLERGGRISSDAPAWINLKDRLASVLGNDVAVNIKFVDEIPRHEHSHKIPTVVSLVHG
ncbi:MAG: phenylacetate--CoA ligase family protein [Deltaproteobacteria bacterium]|nr:phenylacetate--CoA ligase family protein [Deltaproteobacteria bacterium]